MSSDLVSQLADYGDYLGEVQVPITVSEMNVADATPTSGDVDEPESRQPRRRVLVLTGAVVVVLFAGVAVLLSGDDDRLRQIDDPPVTTVAPTTSDASTTTTATTEVGVDESLDQSFEPFISGSFLVEGAPAAQDAASYQTSQFEFVVWDSDRRWEWTIDWESLFGEISSINNPYDFSIEVGENGQTSWDPSTGVFTARNQAHTVEFEFSISGTPAAWTVDIVNAESEELLGQITGSLPTFELNEILDSLIPGAGDGLRLTSYFVIDESGTESVSPPWQPAVVMGEAYHILVVNDTILVFVTVDGQGPGQIHVWRSANGRDWDDQGPTPWSGRTNEVAALAEVDGQVVAMTRKVLEPNVNDDPQVPFGQVRYWTSDDGASWNEITAAIWEQFGVADGEMPSSGPSTPTPSNPPATELFWDPYVAAVTENASAISDDPPTFVLAPNPEQPQFDTSGLGLEVLLEPIRTDAELRSPGSPNPDDWSTDPRLYVGRVPESGDVFGVWQDDDSMCTFMLTARGSPMSCGSILTRSDPYGELLNPAIDRDRGWVVFVPPETSVVAITTRDGLQLWQRPIGGWGVFDLGVQPDKPALTAVVAYDASGNEIGQW